MSSERLSVKNTIVRLIENCCTEYCSTLAKLFIQSPNQLFHLRFIHERTPVKIFYRAHARNSTLDKKTPFNQYRAHLLHYARDKGLFYAAVMNLIRKWIPMRSTCLVMDKLRILGTSTGRSDFGRDRHLLCRYRNQCMNECSSDVRYQSQSNATRLCRIKLLRAGLFTATLRPAGIVASS